MKAATIGDLKAYMPDGISIHAAREGGDLHALPCLAFSTISIHAAREGGDEILLSLACHFGYFNPRRP